jgi:peptidoglycan/LPS O-acetylase OafA/YrhL
MRGRIPQLDLLRGIAVLLVLFVHYPYFKIFELGWVGVDLFFVLSGFLISGLLFTDWKQNGSIRLSRFFIRRSFKIYPSFYFFLFTMTPAVALLPLHLKNHFARFVAEVFFLQDYRPHLWLHTWSLAVEEQFYILLPMVLVFIARLRKSFAIVPTLSILLLVACFALRERAIYTHLHYGAFFDSGAPFYALHFRADALFAGVALGYLFHFRSKLFHRMSQWLLLPLGLLLLIPLFLLRHLIYLPCVLTCNTLAFICLLWWIIPRRMIRIRWIEWVGTYSYSIYLWHLPLMIFLRPLGSHPVWFALYLAGSIGTGYYMSMFIEMRALLARDKYFPSTYRAEHRATGWNGNGTSRSLLSVPLESNT